MRGHSDAADVTGEPAIFEADGQPFDGGAVDDAGDALRHRHRAQLGRRLRS